MPLENPLSFYIKNAKSLRVFEIICIFAVITVRFKDNLLFNKRKNNNL